MSKCYDIQECECDFRGDVMAGCDIGRGGRLYRQVEVVIGPGKTRTELRVEELQEALLKEQQARGEAEKRIEKLEMTVHQYNRRVGFPRYPLKGE